MMRRYIHSAAAHHSNGNALHAAWIRSRFQLVLGRAPLFSDKWNHAQTAQRTKLCIPCPVPQLVSSSMKRVERNWRVEERLTSDQELELCLQQVDAVLPKSKHVARSTPGVSSTPGIRRRQQSRRDTQSEYDEYTRPFKEHSVPDPATVPDDKGKKLAWMLPKCACSLLLASFALAASSWSLTHIQKPLFPELRLQGLQLLSPF